ncbi:MAG TPA: hypothetical protein VFR37_01050 [Longimicrobium sp.]|nr:hypothetical protein [Longimicrobium sp.]
MLKLGPEIVTVWATGRKHAKAILLAAAQQRDPDLRFRDVEVRPGESSGLWEARKTIRKSAHPGWTDFAPYTGDCSCDECPDGGALFASLCPRCRGEFGVECDCPDDGMVLLCARCNARELAAVGIDGSAAAVAGDMAALPEKRGDAETFLAKGTR